MKRLQLALVAAACVVVISGMLLAGLSNYYWQTIDFPWPPVIAVEVAVVGLAAVLLAVRAKTTRERAGWFFGVLWIGGAFLTMTVFGHLRAWNAWLDSSAAIDHRVQVLDSGRQARGQRRIEVPSWRVAGEREVLWAPVRVDSATELIVTTRAGALGLEWIDEIRAP